MSTFNGFLEEFPDIRIDYFRSLPGRSPPLKCFLSHVHSDHLQGLESLKSPFVYCSPATREILLRLEKYPHRINLAKGILESHKQHYKHLKNILKPLPLNTPSEIELGHGKTIQVTLLDANHCAGAVMFLIQGSGKAILYTGDIRSEPWWVDALARNPLVIPYAHSIRCLDKIYLDTTFAPERHEIPTFPTKAEGVAELLRKVAEYPENTTFHFHAWTFGYEEVWIALANVLDSKIHVDDYRLRLYQSLRATVADGPTNHVGRPADGRRTKPRDIYLAPEASALCGYRCGNNDHPGCLTSDQDVRLHSCEAGTDCKALKSPNVVWITPIIAHSADGSDVLEIGAGGGVGDLNQHELELDDQETMELLQLCVDTVKENSMGKETENMVSNALLSPAQRILLDSLSPALSDKELPLKDLARIIVEAVQNRPWKSDTTKGQGKFESNTTLPRQIRFPYSRHSSYDELCHLVGLFRPKDIYPCTVDVRNWTRDVSIRSQFGHLCSEVVFAHDAAMERLEPERELMRSFERSEPAKGSQNELRTSSQASQEEVHLGPPQPVNRNPPSGPEVQSERSTSTNTTPRVKRRRTDLEATHIKPSPNTVTTASTNTFSYDGRLNRIRHSFHDDSHSNNATEKPRSIEHSTSDPTPVHLHAPVPRTMTPNGRRLKEWGKQKQIIKPSCKEDKLYEPLRSESGSKKVTKIDSTVAPQDIPKGTQACPIDLSDVSDKDVDSDATTDGESSAPAARIKNMADADVNEVEGDTQVTLTDSAFDSQSQVQQDQPTIGSKLRNRKEAYRAAKELVESGWVNDFVIVSSNSAHDNEEMEL